MSLSFRKIILCLAACAPLALAACEMSADQPTPPDQIQYFQLSHLAPPAPIDEVAEIADDPRTAIWRPGYWSYDYDSFSWVAGTLIARPSPTAVWSPDEWVQHDYGWAFKAGYWQ